jgi:4a-hydroxytetrahydrobiopterin dehydratase
MSELADRNCVPCRSGVPGLSAEELAWLLPLVPEWQIKEEDGGKRLVRVCRFKNFKAALAFANQVGAAAEAENHHPALLVEWGRVTISWWTHSIGGLHLNDFILAARTDRLFDAELGAG